MPRNARKNNLNNTKVYHIILKGVNGQEIFFEDSDRIKFLTELKKVKGVYHCKIYAYVLMSNHIHILLFDKEDKISQIMHRICTIYAIYFNKKYDRVGHLFQNRFKSKCVNTQNYLLNLLRYIHKNPEKDGICKMELYRWSSYTEYKFIAKIIDVDFILKIFNEDKDKAVERFIQYNRLNEDEYGEEEYDIRRYLTDEEAIEKIKKILTIGNVTSILKLNKKIRDEKIRQIAKIRGISTKQISRILGIHIRTIQRIIKMS